MMMQTAMYGPYYPPLRDCEVGGHRVVCQGPSVALQYHVGACLLSTRLVLQAASPEEILNLNPKPQSHGRNRRRLVSKVQQPALLAWLSTSCNTSLYPCSKTNSLEPDCRSNSEDFCRWCCVQSPKALTDNYHIVKAPVSVLMDESGERL